ncbi:lectin-like domain-containing protein [Kitasatospora acidiphila]|uniref:choice-of-anchor D domain-containing protein n=1 Tax=Kitasatospora acidiphila TaxID=2567942 RepID=UPI003C74308C
MPNPPSRPLRSLLAGALFLGIALTSGQLTLAAPAVADETTVSQDTLRTGWDQNEPGLTPSQVAGSDFGRQFSTAVDGQVYAQPVVTGGTVVVATENDKVYGVAAAGGATTWSRDLGSPWPASVLGCGDLTPNIGVTSTPVVDSATNTVYLTAKVDDGPDSSHPHWYVHAMDATTGAERPGWPVTVQGSPVNNPGRTFDPLYAMQRPGLLLMGGTVYAAFGSHCDLGNYVGYLAGINTTSRALTLWATEDASSSAKAGLWMSGGGPVSDGAGRIFVTTGNGVSPAPGPGTSPPGQLAESLVRVGVNGDGSMSAQDFFSPSNAGVLDQNDTDFGSGGPIGLPGPAFGTTAHPHLMVTVGKDGRIFLLDRDNLGGRSQGPNGTDAVLGTSGPFEGVWGHPAAFGGTSPFVYTVGSNAPLRALAYGTTGSGQPALTSTGTSNGTFGYSSGSPIVTSSGTDPSTALVWVEYSDGANGANGQLRAYDAVPVNGVLNLRYSAPIGTASKFAVPATDSGRVFVGTRDGHLLAFGRPSGAALSGTAVDFGDVPVGSTANGTVTVTATRTVTVSALTAGAPFAAPQNPVLPATLTAGQTLSVPVSFSPTSPAGAIGQLALTTDAGTLSVGLSGYGLQSGLTVTPAALDFGELPTSLTKTLGATFTNTGSTAETVSATTAPGSPFQTGDLPPAGTVLQPKQSLIVQVTYAPTAARSDTGSLAVTSTSGTATLSLTGGAVAGQAVLTLTPAGTDFGSMLVGQTALRSFDISNTGNIPLTITKAAPPAAPFAAIKPVAEGQQLGPGQVIHQTVSVTPTAVGTVTGTYQITSDDGRGPQPVTLTATATAPTTPTRVTVPAPGAGGWQLNGSAVLSGTDLQLTQAVAHQAGSAVYPTPVLTDGLTADFTSVIGGGNGADGQTFALLDPAADTAKSLGWSGGGLGYQSLTGVAVTMDTFKATGAPSGNYMAITVKGGTGFVQTATDVPNLRSGPHAVSVSVSGTTLTASIDGVQVLNASVPTLPPAALVAFTGGTGGLDDIHTVRDVNIQANGYAVAPPGPNGWTDNGSAAMSGTDLVLTQAVANQAGSAFAATPVASANLHAHFTAQIGNGSGADGLAFVLLDASKAGPTALGGSGGGMGYAGLPGVAVVLDTIKHTGDPSNNFVAVATGAVNNRLQYAATSTTVPQLRQGTHTVDVTTTPAGHLQVAIDGRQVIDTPVTLPANVLTGFSGATGGYTDVHTVRGVSIGY